MRRGRSRAGGGQQTEGLRTTWRRREWRGGAQSGGRMRRVGRSRGRGTQLDDLRARGAKGGWCRFRRRHRPPRL